MPDTDREYGGRNTIPVPSIEEYSDFNTWLECVEAWALTTELAKEKQGFLIAQEIPMKSEKYGDRLREDLFKQCPPKTLVNNKEGVEAVLSFLKGY